MLRFFVFPSTFNLHITPMQETDGGIRLSLMSNAVGQKLLRNSIEVSSLSSPRTSNEAHWTLIDLQGVGCCLERTYYSQRSRKDGVGGGVEKHKGNARAGHDDCKKDTGFNGP